MTFRKLTLSTVLTSATALAAHAGSVNDDSVIKEKGGSYEDAASVDGNTATTIEKNAYSENGHDYVSVTGQNMKPDEGTSDGIESRKVDALGTVTEQEVVLKAAEAGTLVRTVDGEVVGQVIGTRDMGDAGAAVVVDVDDAANLNADRVVFTVDVLNSPSEGDIIEYSSSMEILRNYIDENSSS